ncbi:MAG: hypothetical protein KDJ73_05080 [Notoacmeibacter sp.]|nr:hypothetical protein [Notoacmeibacter sp.]MCC0032734.1 hypothetical protein [Brucellaceae bacterium]
MKAAVKLAGVFAVLAPVQAFAVTGNIPFNGTVTDTCVITVGSSGTIAPNTAYTVLGSTETGGAPGTATILATGSGFNVFADAPTAWGTAPASASTAVFATTYSLSGANTASNVAGATGTALSNFGTTNASVNLTATLPSGTYEAGAYAATVVLRCE